MKRKAASPPPPPPPPGGSYQINLLSESEVEDSDSEELPPADVIAVGGHDNTVIQEASGSYIVITGSAHIITVRGSGNHIAIRCVNSRINVSGSRNTLLSWGPCENVITFTSGAHDNRLRSLSLQEY